MKLFLLGMLASAFSFASNNDILHRPKSFQVAGGKAVFVDFREATYNVNYDIPNQKAHITAEIKFNAPEAGRPIFDSVTVPESISLDGQSVTATETQTPSSETTLRVINSLVSIGDHILKISLPLNDLVEFKDGGVRSAFWTSDLDERQFLERYMPANFEFDQVKMTFNITFSGGAISQKLYTNGSVKAFNKSSFQVTYPDYFTASSVYFHTIHSSATEELRFSLKSVDGRNIPAVIYFVKTYGNDLPLKEYQTKITEIFHELEGDYGAFPHPSITVYNSGAGGMEYCGATMTDAWALGHELFHSYFARGVMPANGNAGWIDEALASWRDERYPRVTTLSGSSMMSSHPYYTRTTDTDAYSFGAEFMSYLDARFASQGGLKPFMRLMMEKKVFSPLFVEDFIKEMGSFYGSSVDADFKKYTFGSTRNLTNTKKAKHIHRKLTLQELKNYL